MLDYLDLLEEDVNPDDVDVSSIKFHCELNPIIWAKVDGEYLLRDDFKKKLTDIADKFSEFIRYKGSKFAVEDIVLTGSNCNFNYTETSDLDIHLLVDYSSVGGDAELASQYLYDKKLLWTMKQDIKVKGIPIECFAANSEDKQVKGAAYYSLMSNQWIVKPDRKNIVVDLGAIKEKAAEIMDLAEKCGTVEQLEKVQDKIWRMRRSGLSSRGEFSSENITYKILRTNGTVDQIKTKLARLEQI